MIFGAEAERRLRVNKYLENRRADFNKSALYLLHTTFFTLFY